MQQNAARTIRGLDLKRWPGDPVGSEYQYIVIEDPVTSDFRDLWSRFSGELNVLDRPDQPSSTFQKLDCTHGSLCSANAVLEGTKLGSPDAKLLFSSTHWDFAVQQRTECQIPVLE
jgi:hypothetical protein